MCSKAKGTSCTTLFSILILWMLSGCLGQDSLEELAENSENFFSEQKIIRIIEEGNAGAPSVGNKEMIVNQSLTVRAALYNAEGTFLKDQDVSWVVTSSDFDSGDYTISADKTKLVFNPKKTGRTTIQGFYSGSDTNIMIKSDSTGDIVVSSEGHVDSLSLIAGDNQTAIVNNNLSIPLKVQALDKFGDPVAGADILFSVSQGSGSIIGANPVITDTDGFASLSVKLGTQAGANSDKFRAYSVGNPDKVAEFSASAVAGAAGKFVWTTQPSLTFAGIQFGVQPVVQLQDEYGNPVSTSGTVTALVNSGVGGLIGTTTSSMSSGIATFSDLGYDTEDSDVVLSVFWSGVTGDSDPFDVGAAPPGACQTNDTFFKTAKGGCQDLVTGLVWSQPTSGSLNWGQAVWDSRLSGTFPQDSYDLERTNDYAEDESPPVSNDYCAGYTSSPSGFCDYDTTSYCHDLIQGGYRDWRLPSRLELIALSGNAQAGAGGTAYLNGSTDRWFWASNLRNGNRQKWVVNPSTGSNTTTDARSPNTRGVVCVRDAENQRTAPTKLGIDVVRHARTMNTMAAFYGWISVQVKDANGNDVSAEDIPITATASNGNLAGTTVVNTTRRGVAVFSELIPENTGTNVIITFTSPGLDPVTYTVERVGAFPHTCYNENADFITADGGCKYVGRNIVFSNYQGNHSWYQTIWEHRPGFNTVPEASDGSNTDDYQNDPGTHPDNSTINICHELIEGGYDDWRVPFSFELEDAFQSAAEDHFNFTELRDAYFWTAQTQTWRGDQWASGVRLRDGHRTHINKGNDLRVLCVRDP